MTRACRTYAFTITAVLWLVPLQAWSQETVRTPHHILLIRHAEKTGDKTDVHLSKKGNDRAAILFQLFERSPIRPEPFPKPDFIFAASNSAGSHRPLETVTPLSTKLQLPINEAFDSKLPLTADAKSPSAATGKSDMFALRREIFGNPKYFGKVILISWRHSTLPDLAKALGVKNAPATWDDNTFDRVWQLSFDSRGAVTFRNLPQRLLPADS